MRVPVNAMALRRGMAARGLDGASLAQAAGVSPSTVSRACNGHAVEERTVLKISRALHRIPADPIAQALLTPDGGK